MNDKLLSVFQANQSLYEDVVSNLIFLSPIGGVFVDCGAHTGAHTARMLRRADVTKVIAIEAIPALCGGLEKRFGSDKKFQLVRAAIGKEIGEIKFNVAHNNLGYSGIRKRDLIQVTEWHRINVTLTTLDSCISENASEVGLIKLDLEGGELDALRGGDGIIGNSRPLIIFENGLRKTADLYGYSRDDFFEFFSRHNYVVYDFFGHVVNSKYWDDTLLTYMFAAMPKNSAHEAWFNNCRESIITGVARNQ